MKYIKSVFLILFILLLIHPELIGQCPMCKMSAESNMQNGGSAGKGLNSGILYMLALPYVIGAAMIYLFRKTRKNLDQA